MNFSSDNAAGISTEVFKALAEANAGDAAPYGADDWTAQAEVALREVFECDCSVFLVSTGTAANALALAALTPPWGAIFCHEDAHVRDDECGAPEFFSAGAKLVGIPGNRGKIDAAGLDRALRAYPRGLVKQVQPAALTLTQATESGTLYGLDEIAHLSSLAHAAGVGVHMDGARFANAIAALGCTPAQMSWKAGVDVLSFGTTKNGTLCCEAAIFFDKARAEDFAYRRKRGGHTLSKGRYLGAQMVGYLRNGHWLDLARHANAMAARLAAGLMQVRDIRLPWGCEANEIFVLMPKTTSVALKQAGAVFYEWSATGLNAYKPDSDDVFVRLVTSFATKEADVDRFIEIARAAVVSNVTVSRLPQSPV